MDIMENLDLCERIIIKEYETNNATTLDVLNEFCAEFHKFCNKLHKVLIFDLQDKFDVIETIFLCLNQTICCIKYLEKIMKAEKFGNTSLFLTRKYFFDRILWCFTKIKSFLQFLSDDEEFLNKKPGEPYLVDLLDAALEILLPFCNYDHNKNMNTKNFTTQALSHSQKLRALIDKIVSQTLGFANVSEFDDKKIIIALCLKVLRDCIEFEMECLFEFGKENENEIHLKAVIIENALYKLEDFINESLLRLIYSVFIDLNQDSIEKIRKAIANKTKDENIDNMIADFDIKMDRLLQIGMMAIAFASNSQVKSIVRNSMASLESLDSYLIASLYVDCNLHSLILEEHFLEEFNRLKRAIQSIIETDSFVECFLNILNINIKKKFDFESMNKTVLMANLLIEHIELNKSELNFMVKQDELNKYNNFKLIVCECQAALACANQIDPQRVLKRFKIMKSCLKKVHYSLSNCSDSGKNKNQKNVFITSEDLAESQKMFESLGISPTTKQLLYQSKRERKNITGSLIVQCSRQLNFSKDYNGFKNSTERKTVKRCFSLRTAMFKRQKNEETQRIYKVYTESTMNLGLTDILDQLTSLSSSFNNYNNVLPIT